MSEQRIQEETEETGCTCLDGWHYIGHMVESTEDLAGEVEVLERVPCRLCAGEG